MNGKRKDAGGKQPNKSSRTEVKDDKSEKEKSGISEEKEIDVV